MFTIGQCRVLHSKRATSKFYARFKSVRKLGSLLSPDWNESWLSWEVSSTLIDYAKREKPHNESHEEFEQVQINDSAWESIERNRVKNYYHLSSSFGPSLKKNLWFNKWLTAVVSSAFY